MYKPMFNKVLVEIDDKDAKWGTGNDDSLGGADYREGKVIEGGVYVLHKDYPEIPMEKIAQEVERIKDKQIMWHEGHEAGTVFEENGKKYALIFWWDIIGVKE